jgi:hypothetical protein
MTWQLFKQVIEKSLIEPKQLLVNEDVYLHSEDKKKVKSTAKVDQKELLLSSV